ncbi:MAG: ThiF family adenylyltransferase [Thiobacillaceae bacterium]|nr:ThiF family adenylyltransferase [Thiobacillaceae bacterium]
MTAFDYAQAFSRNIGWVTEAEQARLLGKRVAIAGMGGVGGFHLLTLARLGVGQFNIADLDTFELANFNRQAGAGMAAIDRAKVEVLAEQARQINPELELRVFPQGVQGDGIPAITVAPLGMSAALVNFLPGGMSFADYFQWGDRPELEKAVRFLVGLAPNALHRHYLADRSRVNLAERRGPSTVMACSLCAGVAGCEALKILLGRGRVLAAPHAVQFDAYRNKLGHTWRPGGNRHPLNRLAIAVAGKMLGITDNTVRP